jgi:small-conductance mechanosensitive channel
MSIYIAVVLVLGCLVLLRALYVLRAGNRRRLRSAKNRTNWSAIPSSGLQKTKAENARARMEALERIEQTFTVSRRIMVPLIVAVTAVLACIPFMDRAPAATLSIMAGVATLLMGIAARPVIENAVAGLMISYSRTINIGDTVTLEGHYGTIEDISVTHTTVKVWNWNRYLIPNGKMLALDFENLSLGDEDIWSHVEFIVGYDADLTLVEEIAREAVEASPNYAGSEPPRFWYSDLRPEGVVCWIAGWARTPSESWALTSDTRRGLVTGFQAQGIPVHSHRLHVEGPASPQAGGQALATPLRSLG